ncbi:MAG: hypothetical protein R2795_20365 [Saprospiraceae bacterium]
MYFSTNDSRISIGGLDVVRAIYLPEAARWSALENMGLPVNSAGDDAFFTLSKDGFTGFFSSSRKDAFGERDVYVAYFTRYRKEMEWPDVAFTPPQSAVTTPPQETTPTKPNEAPPSGAWSISFLQPPPIIPADAWRAEVLSVLQKHPNDHLVLSYYLPADAGGKVGTRLYDALVLLQPISQQFINSGIAPHRIFMRALPYAGHQHQVQATIAPAENASERSGVPVVGLSSPGSPSLPANESLCYKIQIVSVQKAYTNAQLDSENDVMLEKAAHLPYYRYTLGAARSFSEAAKWQKQAQRNGFSGAYIVPYVYGERLEKERLQQFETLFPDLRNYLGR